MYSESKADWTMYKYILDVVKEKMGAAVVLYAGGPWKPVTKAMQTPIF